jgi:hypothetical protein
MVDGEKHNTKSIRPASNKRAATSAAIIVLPAPGVARHRKCRLFDAYLLSASFTHAVCHLRSFINALKWLLLVD